jgi:cephalosporin-C deacetylase-like acetyl esterase
MRFGKKFFSASRANLDSLPEAAGVFTLYEDGRLIFIGYADGGGHTLKSQIMDHKEGREAARTQFFDHYTREVTPNVVLRYRELMVQYARKYHRWPEGNAHACRVLDDVMLEADSGGDSGPIAA